MKKLSVPLLAILLYLGLWGYEHTQLQSPMNEVLAHDSRNAGIEVTVSYDGWFPSGTIVYDLKRVSGNNSQLDVFRVLMQYAVKKQHTRFDHVILAYRGTKKFQLRGAFFQETGGKFEAENPVYTIRTFPQNVLTLTGNAAFSQWSGGLIGVLGKQTEDFSEFNRQWYLN